MTGSAWVVDYGFPGSTMYGKIFFSESEATKFYEEMSICPICTIREVKDFWL